MELARGREARPREIERVAVQTSAEAAAWAFGQWALRERAAAKFCDPESLLFDRDGLEMATSERVASYHASCFPDGAAVLDMTAGIGSDARALARRGPVMACEVDADRARLLGANLDAEIWNGDGRLRMADYDYVWMDPMRRGPRGRLRPEDYEPNPWEIREALASKEKAGIKLSPMVEDRLLLDLGRQIEFVSFRGECREALVWTGRTVTPGTCAVHIESGKRLLRSPDPKRQMEPLFYVFEADPACIRAHALGAFGLNQLGDSPGYLTGEDLLASEWLTAYEVLWHGPLRREKIQAACRELDLQLTAVKKRGVEIDPPTFQKQIKAVGRQEAVAFLYSFDKRQRVLLTKKLPPP